MPDDEDRLDSQWRHPDYDLLDWGLELETAVGRIFGSFELFSPHAVVLEFDGMAVVLSGAGDQLLVSFGDEAARRNQVGPYSSRDHRSFHERVARLFRDR